MVRMGSHVSPPFVVLENTVGPRTITDWVASVNTRRSHTAYTRRLLTGSAVTLSLSSTTVVSTSAMSGIGSLQVRPSLVDRLTRIAWLASSTKSNESEIWCATPSGEIVTHGSDARS